MEIMGHLKVGSKNLKRRAHEQFLISSITSSSKALQLDPDWTFVDFLHAASNRLDLIPTASRAFNANGTSSYHNADRIEGCHD
jgi:hypothetical protein